MPSVDSGEPRAGLRGAGVGGAGVVAAVLRGAGGEDEQEQGGEGERDPRGSGEHPAMLANDP